MKSKLDFTQDKLRPIILSLASMKGYENPSTYLDELLNEVEQFNDTHFRFNFFLNIHNLCQENAEMFWSEGHRQDITKWLGKARGMTSVFTTTWEETAKEKQRQTDTSETKNEKRNYIPLAFSYYYKQSVQEIEWFDNWLGGRENAYKKVVSEHYKNPAKTAWKQFQREYAKIEKEHSNNRHQLCSKENYPTVLELLKDSPKGLAKAKEELSKAIT